MTDTGYRETAGLSLPFRWWDGIVAVFLLYVSGVPTLFLDLGEFWLDLLALALIAGYLVLRRRFDLSLVLGDRPDRQSVLAGVLIGLAWVVAFGLLVFGVSRALGVDDPVYPDWVVFTAYIEVPLTALLGSVLLAPLLEEIVFRSILYRGLLASTPRWMAAGITSMLFGMVHFLDDLGIVRAMVAAALSLTLIWLYHRTRSLWPPIVLHATVNASVILFGYVAAQIVGRGTVLN